MAFSLDHLLESVVPAVITAGGTAASTILAFFRNLQKRIEDLEKKVGSMDGKNGLVFSMHVAEEAIKSVREQVENAPPREGTRWRLPSFSNEGLSGEYEQKLRDFDRRLKDMEDNIDRFLRKKYVSEDEFEQADRERAAEIAAVRTTMAEVRGLLEGLKTALGLVKSERR